MNFNQSAHWLKSHNYGLRPGSINHNNSVPSFVCPPVCNLSSRPQCQADIFNPPHCSHETPPQANRASKNNWSHLKVMREWCLIIWFHRPLSLLFPSDPTPPTVTVARKLWFLISCKHKEHDFVPVLYPCWVSKQTQCHVENKMYSTVHKSWASPFKNILLGKCEIGAAIYWNTEKLNEFGQF